MARPNRICTLPLATTLGEALVHAPALQACKFIGVPAIPPLFNAFLFYLHQRPPALMFR